MNSCDTCEPLVKVISPTMADNQRQFIIEQAASRYISDSIQFKGVRAIFDPNLGPSGG